MLVYPAKRRQRQAGRQVASPLLGFAELLIDCEEDGVLWAALVGMARVKSG
jgi:hypothetical protein